mmetsp:Transcript_23165/g.62698  ORF Transcript_23165/g.62698 Transcript_23165/m.62698 type:complete len:193 (-) Transcript_23165:537-1115(-)
MTGREAGNSGRDCFYVQVNNSTVACAAFWCDLRRSICFSSKVQVLKITVSKLRWLPFFLRMGQELSADDPMHMENAPVHKLLLQAAAQQQASSYRVETPSPDAPGAHSFAAQISDDAMRSARVCATAGRTSRCGTTGRRRSARDLAGSGRARRGSILLLSTLRIRRLVTRWAFQTFPHMIHVHDDARQAVFA